MSSQTLADLFLVPDDGMGAGHSEVFRMSLVPGADDNMGMHCQTTHLLEHANGGPMMRNRNDHGLGTLQLGMLKYVGVRGIPYLGIEAKLPRLAYALSIKIDNHHTFRSSEERPCRDLSGGSETDDYHIRTVGAGIPCRKRLRP
jgi:hypothetical protein